MVSENRPKPHSSEPVGRTLNSGNSAIQYVRVNHGCLGVPSTRSGQALWPSSSSAVRRS